MYQKTKQSNNKVHAL